ncbi:unnamed protein product (macronuclear) [Paramecium tetraurelia]|uniref:MARVEL domain-containing protein n=1 Tax=Paramecium tetraurelia TaxID=5888 RepID=A0DCK4_PARTE|nr:uncharacterized protein GSPATT00015649001 [Paramecium tetraurelia]CAK80771.1 unnamed protein product [Paramecium tetraurelia]|eukprot:XP_001448168.1 hypothetical protein (macronuclear) [Paramecium tetraurelia strain d4-2]
MIGIQLCGKAIEEAKQAAAAEAQAVAEAEKAKKGDKEQIYLQQMAFDKALVTKFTTLGVVGITIGLAVWGFFTPLCPDETCIDTVINNVFICFNLSLLSMVLLPSEFQVKWIQDGFGLIDNLFGRGLYIFFIGSWVFGLHTRYIESGIRTYSLVVAILDLCVGVLYVIFYFAFGESAQPK